MSPQQHGWGIHVVEAGGPRTARKYQRSREPADSARAPGITARAHTAPAACSTQADRQCVMGATTVNAAPSLPPPQLLKINRADGSAQVLRHLEGVADGPPHGLGVHAVREGALDGAPAELIEHEVLGHALRVDITELRVHPRPEFRQPHAPRLLPPPGRGRRGGRAASVLASRAPRETFRPMCRY